MKKSGGMTNSTKNIARSKDEQISELETHIKKAHPSVRLHISELRKEITRLQVQNAKQGVAHFSMLEKVKAKAAEQTKPILNITFAGDGHKPSDEKPA